MQSKAPSKQIRRRGSGLAGMALMFLTTPAASQ
jgi:hypothetical protein